MADESTKIFSLDLHQPSLKKCVSNSFGSEWALEHWFPNYSDPPSQWQS